MGIVNMDDLRSACFMGSNVLIAIDGPAGAGKSTVARGVARCLGVTYIDTGAMYRAIAWKMLQEAVEVDYVGKLLNQTLITFHNGHLYLDHNKVGDEIRTPEVSRYSSEIAKMKDIRLFLVEKQRELARVKSVVMDGRDIGTYVLPFANVKIFLTASIHQRAIRRYKELKEKGIDVDLKRLEQEIRNRDYADYTREMGPLKQAEDAVLIDTSEKEAEEVIDFICEYASKSH